MKNDITIDIKNLSKKYKISVGYQPDSLREKIIELAKTPFNAFNRNLSHKKKVFWALKDISFQVKRGEVLGIIGRNGAGKSTLLKILSRVTDPTSGQITMKGKVSSLLEVGTGFNPELTGRENIYLNGAIIGMSKKEIALKFKKIVEFSGVEKFLDTPVKRYSSGMYVRLAFAVAAHLDSDILLIDEVLAVGDAEFQKKCLGKMNSLAETGKTIIFVSHNLHAISRLCTKVIYLERGKIQDIGNPSEMITDYIGEQKSSLIKNLIGETKREGRGRVIIKQIKVFGEKNNVYPTAGGSLYIELILINKIKENISYRPSISIRMGDQIPLISLDSKLIGYKGLIQGNSTIKSLCYIPKHRLNPGEYLINVAIYDNDGNIEDWLVPAIKTKIIPDSSRKYIESNQFPVYTNFSWKQDV
jgi:lipopolysaccharide transport system ATP-binding protein